jgi:hypothetical protein
VPELPLASLKRLLPRTPRLTNERILSGLKRLASRVRCYGHVKTLVYIDMDGAVTVDADVTPWHTYAVARAVATRGKSFLEGVTDHLISNYIRGLEEEDVAGNRRSGVRPRRRTGADDDTGLP